MQMWIEQVAGVESVRSWELQLAGKTHQSCTLVRLIAGMYTSALWQDNRNMFETGIDAGVKPASTTPLEFDPKYQTLFRMSGSPEQWICCRWET